MREPALPSLAAAKRLDPEAGHVFRLYVAGSNHQSIQAVERLRRALEIHLPGRYELEVVDIYERPDRAVAAQVVAAPTLVREFPLPKRRIVGDLSDRARLLRALELDPIP